MKISLPVLGTTKHAVQMQQAPSTSGHTPDSFATTKVRNFGTGILTREGRIQFQTRESSDTSSKATATESATACRGSPCVQAPVPRHPAIQMSISSKGERLRCEVNATSGLMPAQLGERYQTRRSGRASALGSLDRRTLRWHYATCHLHSEQEQH